MFKASEGRCWAISSVGESAPLIRVRSLVQIQYSPPRGCSSVGRALPLQGRCQRFESAYFHHLLVVQPLVVDRHDRSFSFSCLRFEKKKKKIKTKRSDESTMNQLKVDGERIQQGWLVGSHFSDLNRNRPVSRFGFSVLSFVGSD